MRIWDKFISGLSAVLAGSDSSYPSVFDMLPAHVPVDYNIPMPRKKQAPKQRGFDWKKLDRPSWEQPRFDLSEIDKAIRTESYARLSIDKHREHVLRNGWSYVGRNPQTVKYIYKRMAELSENMDRPVESEIRQAVKNFIKYSNFFLFWTRDRSRPYTSRFRRKLGRPTGLFSLSPPAMRFRRDPKNRVLEWYQVVKGHEDEQNKPVDVVHGAFDRDDGFVLGVPFLLPVLDDIIAWRRFEEMAEIMAHKFAFPLFHHKIGNKERDPEEYDDGSNEIGEAVGAVAGMAPEGHLFTSYRHEIEVVGAKTKALDLHPTLAYWENRVIAGLNLSTLDIGRGDTATRNTAESLSKGLADRCAEYQNVFSELFTFHVLCELLLEGGYDLTPDNMVYMYFPAIDREAKRAEENHLKDLFTQHIITHEEARREMGREPLTKEQWKDGFFERIMKPAAIIKAVDEPFTSAAKTAAKSRNQSQPSNQHGTKSTKTRVTRDTLADLFSMVIDRGPEDLEWELIEVAVGPVTRSMQDGIRDYSEEFACDVYLGSSMVRGFITDCVVPYVEDKVRNAKDIPSLRAALDIYAPLFTQAARNYAYARAGQVHAKHKYVRWALTGEACADCQRLRPMRIRRFTLGQMLTPHPKCVSGLEFCSDGE